MPAAARSSSAALDEVVLPVDVRFMKRAADSMVSGPAGLKIVSKTK
jgi:hypothetical protein